MSEEKQPEETVEQRAAKLPFDEALVLKFRQHINRALTDHPELRSVTVIFDYVRNLNESPIKAGIWLGDSGPVVSAAAIIGTLQQHFKVFKQQIGSLQALEDAMREELTIVAQELLKQKKELAEHEQKE